MEMIRKAAVAGAFYPQGKGELLDELKSYFSQAKETKIPGALKGLVVPHAGYIYSGPVAAFGYKLLKAHRKGINKILLLGPSHYAAFLGAAEGAFDKWETPLGKIMAGSIKERLGTDNSGLFSVFPEAHIPEHCLEVQLPFLQFSMQKEFEIFPLLLGQLDCEGLARALLPLMDDSTLVIASSDLSHYLPYEQAVERDSIANEAVPSLNIRRFMDEGDACGKKAILTLMHIAKLQGWKGKFLDYRNSGDTAGSRDKVVGYGCYAFYGKKSDYE
jgi:AmmeMemoRadiSam system protein B